MISRSITLVRAARECSSSGHKTDVKVQCSRELLSGIELFSGLESWLRRLAFISTKLCSDTRICFSTRTRASSNKSPPGNELKASGTCIYTLSKSVYIDVRWHRRATTFIVALSKCKTLVLPPRYLESIRASFLLGMSVVSSQKTEGTPTGGFRGVRYIDPTVGTWRYIDLTPLKLPRGVLEGLDL
jgi:hypothetical protein